MATRIGEMPCLNPRCGCQDVAVEITDAGTWQAKCHKCQFPTFGKRGTKWRRDMEQLVKLDEQQQSAAPAAGEPPKAPKDEPPKVANSVFSLGSL